jgi:hypothetical protein
MTSIEAYKGFELKLNKLDSADNIDISPGEFVLIFNEQQVKWYKARYGKSSIYSTSEVQALTNIDQPLNPTNITDRYNEYDLPSDYMDYIRSYCFCSKDNCKDRFVRTYQTHLTDIEFYLRDEHNKPSFEYQETPITVSKDKIQVYKTDFTIGSVFLTYYRYPLSIDILGYTRIDQTPSTTINPELPDEMVNEIIDLCVLEVQRSTENGDGFQLANNRLNT